MPNPTPIRQRLRTFLTPDIRDFIVAESKDVAFREIPEYGTPHPDTRRYPHHLFAFAQPADDQGLLYTLLYVMERAEQDAYNWEMSDAGLEGTKFLQVQRSYVTLRSKFNSTTPAMGSAMPNVPAGEFSGTFVLADRKQRRSQDKELDTLFVVEDMTYIQKEVFADIEPDEISGIANRVTTTLYYRGESITHSATARTVEAWFALPSDNFWATDATGYGRTGKQLTDNWFAVSYGKIVDLDTQYEKTADRLRPDRFFCPKSVTQSTEITADNTPGEPIAPTAEIGQSVTVQKVGRIKKVSTTQQSGNPSVLRGTELLSDDGYIYPESEQLIAASAVTTSRLPIAVDGTVTSFQKLDACNALQVTRQAISPEDEHVKAASQLIPNEFLDSDKTDVRVETVLGVAGEPASPVADSKRAIKVRKKGVVEIKETTTQVGQTVALRGTSYLSDDGNAYPTRREILPASQVPAVRSQIQPDGTIETYEPSGANYVIKTRQVAASPEDEHVKAASQLIPAEFLDSEKTETLIETTFGGVGPPAAPTAVSKNSVRVRKKGAIEVKETTTQLGDVKILKGTSYLPEDGNTYVTQREIIPAAQAPPIPATIQADGTVETYEPSGANHVIKTKRVVESPLPGTAKKVSQLAPEKFFMDQRTLRTDTVTLAVIGEAPDPAPEAKKSKEVEQRGKIRRERVTEQIGDFAAVRSSSFDERTGESFLETEEIVDSASVVPVAISASGELTSFEGIDAKWSAKRKRQIVSTLERPWTEVINYEWPPVLIALDFVTWTRKDSRTVIQPIVRYKQGFTGPQSVQVRQWWQKNQPPVIVPVSMISEGIQFWCPLYNISIPPCLHSTVALQCNIGSSDPDWAPQSFVQTFPATNVIDWPESVVWTESKPYLGGYLIHQYTLNRPS